ncbi:M48 family metallopeptidase [Anthocerotibacter panamensis]|uniref:M48 family metallopeptidase n=1 Tax=Anthocerotibacter panamensis TaxID=2857077 RepID=UPI001C4086D0|nr:SprT family zinc-dependent metalloprotease [Anthocerotibacter panamensis]
MVKPLLPLPDYVLRVSPRARQVYLKVSLQKGLVVTIPPGFNRQRIPEILEAKRDWLRRATERLAQQQAHLLAHPPDHLPTVLSLEALAEEWSVFYSPTDLPRTKVSMHGNELILEGKVADMATCRPMLYRWLTHKAQQHLVPWLESLSLETGLPFSQALIKGQKTRWGSCSRRGTISLNVQLLFLPAPLVRYVLIHELCHTREMNHSPRFWALVAHHLPHYRQLRTELRQAQRLVPTWLTHP